ncbi:MAG: MBL fold metallo-hydrolase [Myxococcales bacterium]|nr:MBL fold metallo-hydrolase [Myxococcales bacterium]
MTRAWIALLVSLLPACVGGEDTSASEGRECLPAPQPSPTPAPARRRAEGPRLRVLGIAQDGGLPHVACDCPRCEAARTDPTRASAVASVALIAPESGAVWLVDATPDLPAQLDLLADVRRRSPGARPAAVDRDPLAGIFLTHAHMGHYLGLAHLGYEAAASEGTPVHASARMLAFLGQNAPWDQLLRLGNIEAHPAEPGRPIALAEGLQAEALAVPHRAEYTDTFAWYLAGPRKRVLYIPDTDPWHRWTDSLERALTDVDLLLVDGTFYSGDELPGRDIAEIGHPLIVDTMERLTPQVAAGKLEVWFIHLNHSNPALDPTGPERAAIEAGGFRVAVPGDEYAL